MKGCDYIIQSNIKYKIIEGVNHKLCNRCKLYYPATAEFFYLNKTNKSDGLYPYCIACAISKAKNWQSENIEAKRKFNRKYMNSPKAQKDTRIRLNKWRGNGGLKEYQRTNKNKIIMYYHNRRAFKELLPNSLTELDLIEIKGIFNNKCALTSSSEVDIDHFIPLAWGHGGTYKGNIYPLNSKLNNTKRTINPFKWVNKENVIKKIDLNRFKQLVIYLADKNQMTLFEFTAFVYWCENNKRKTKDIKRDNEKSSIALFREQYYI